MVNYKNLDFMDWNLNYDEFIIPFVYSYRYKGEEPRWYHAKLCILDILKLEILSKKVNDSGFISYDVKFTVKDGGDNVYDLLNYMSEEELGLYQNGYTKMITYLLMYNYMKFIKAPVGYSLMADDNEPTPIYNDSYEINNFIHSFEKHSKLDNTFRKVYSNSRLGFLVTDISELPEEFIKFYCKDINTEDNDWLNRHIANIRVLDYNSIDNNIDIEQIRQIASSKANRDPFKNASKVYVGLYKNDILYDIKETNILLNKNKNFIHNRNADEVRLLEYKRIQELVFNQWNCREIKLMEKHWIRSVVNGLSFVYDLDGNKRRAIHQEINYRTHLREDKTMYLQNGNILSPLSRSVIKND